MDDEEFVESEPEDHVYRGRVHRGCRHRCSYKPFTMTLAVLAGALTAFWLFTKVIPGVHIVADEEGRWESIEIDWSRKAIETPVRQVSVPVKP